MVYTSTFENLAGSPGLRMTQQPNGSLISMPQARGIGKAQRSLQERYFISI